MEEQYEKKITWTIKDFTSLGSEKIYSKHFVVGDSQWRILAYPKGNGDSINKCLSLYLDVADSESLPCGWERQTKYRLTVVNQNSEKLSRQTVSQDRWFYQKITTWGSSSLIRLTELVDINGGFLVNGKVKIVAEVGLLEVIGKSDVLEETLLVKETMVVHGFHVLPSQVESVNSLFEKHPDIASNFRPKNPHLRTTYLNSLLCLNEILCQSPEKLSSDDLANAYSTLFYLTKAGFELDWLEKKLKEVGMNRLQEINEERTEIEAMLQFLK